MDTSFCLGVDLSREIQGILGLKTWVRDPQRIKQSAHDRYRSSDKESRRWWEMVQAVQSQSPDPSRLVHVADREADDYASFCEMRENGYRFVFRVRTNRKILDPSFLKLFDSLRAAQLVCEREVPISPRGSSGCQKKTKTHPPRKARVAHLGVAAKEVEICRHKYVDKKYPKTIRLNFVRVFEMNPPEGEVPVEWFLVTQEPIETTSDLLRIVDIYRVRWVIEEYFKALKTGCALQEREFASLGAMLRCLAIFAPIACQLYNLKILGREHPEQPADRFANPVQLKILAQETHRPEEQLKTLGALLEAVARLGGHLKHNGPPGWQVLARGYERLLQWEQGYRIALEQMAPRPTPCSATCVQS